MNKSDKSSVTVILVGTDPKSNAGGIASVFPGYIKAFELMGATCKPIVSHHAKKWGGKWRFLFTAIFSLIKLIGLQHKGSSIVYAHAGEWPSLIRKCIILSLSRVFRVKTILHLHAPEIENYLKSNFKKKCFKILISPADVICVLTPWWKKQLISEGVDGRIEVIPNPLTVSLEDIAKIPKSISENSTRREVFVLVMARLEEGKGVDLVIEAMPLLPEHVVVRVGGEGRDREKMENRVCALGLTKRVKFMGWVSGNEKEHLFLSSDIFCLPSSRDALCTGFVEAMAYGLPVVTLQWGGNGDVVPHMKAGVVIEKPSGECVAEGISSLFDKKIAYDMGTAGKAWVLSEYSYLSVSEKIKSIIVELVEERGGK